MTCARCPNRSVALTALAIVMVPLGAFWLGEGIHAVGLNPFVSSVPANAADAAPGSISLRSTEPLRVSSPDGVTIPFAGEFE